MPRLARDLVDGFVYHVINRGNGRQEIPQGQDLLSLPKIGNGHPMPKESKRRLIG
jgi:hypothetical protein